MSKSDAAEVVGYTLTMDNVTRILAATKNFQSMQMEDPAFGDAITAMAGKSLSEQAVLLQGMPKAVAVLRGAGLTVREYAIGGRAFAGARTLDGMKGQTISPQMRAAFPVSDAQAAFAADHRKEIDALMRPTSPPAGTE